MRNAYFAYLLLALALAGSSVAGINPRASGLSTADQAKLALLVVRGSNIGPVDGAGFEWANGTVQDGDTGDPLSVSGELRLDGGGTVAAGQTLTVEKIKGIDGSTLTIAAGDIAGDDIELVEGAGDGSSSRILIPGGSATVFRGATGGTVAQVQTNHFQLSGDLDFAVAEKGITWDGGGSMRETATDDIDIQPGSDAGSLVNIRRSAGESGGNTIAAAFGGATYSLQLNQLDGDSQWFFADSQMSTGNNSVIRSVNAGHLTLGASNAGLKGIFLTEQASPQTPTNGGGFFYIATDDLAKLNDSAGANVAITHGTVNWTP